MLTGLAVAVSLMAATANNQPEVSLSVPPPSAPTPFRSGFSQPRLIPDAIVSDRAADDFGSPRNVAIDSSAYGEIASDNDGNCPCGECEPCGPCGECDDCRNAKPPKMEHCGTIRCDMPQHIAYYPPYHENYYFRPYSVAQLARQQEIVTSWGGDPRNPYANAIFQRVYDEMGLETIDTPEPNAIPQPTPDANVDADEPTA